jgi:NAD(P)-dependent dehydrogenase (short-subunit alcohol dehydrogenase family)
MAMAGLLGARDLVVTEDATGVAQALVALFLAQGLPARGVQEVPAGADAVVFLGGLRPVASIQEATAVNREAFHAARSVAAAFTQRGGAFVTVQDTGGDFGLAGCQLHRTPLGGLRALARSAALEWPKAAVKALDLERGSRDPEALAKAILTELLEGGGTCEVGLHADGRRSTLAAVPTPVPALGAEGLPADAVIVASGGGRGVTAAALVALAQSRPARFVLLGRTSLDEEAPGLSGLVAEPGLRQALVLRAQAQGEVPKPAVLNAQVAGLLAVREIRATLAALAAAGSQARYIALDVCDPAAVAKALATVRQDWGPIRAVVHGAGLLADKAIAEKTDKAFDRVYDTKVLGLAALLEATAQDPLASLCLFSSIAAHAGNPGQCDYAMANEGLNLMASAEQARRGPACVVRAIGWGAWDGGMVTPSLKAHFQRQGVGLIPLAAGARHFVTELQNRDGEGRILLLGGPSGAGPLGAARTPEVVLEQRVSWRSHPQLADHAVAGLPVLPLVLALEWFLRAARACRPDLLPVAVKQIKVLRGIRLQNFQEGGDCFQVRARQLGDAPEPEFAMALLGAKGTMHYSATVQLARTGLPQPAPLAAPFLEPWTQVACYDGHILFHGPSFQVIQSIQGRSREGVLGTLVGTGERPWPRESWHSDPAALDGGLQLAALWSEPLLGGATLPMALGEFRTYAGGLSRGPLQAVLHGRKILDTRTVSDVRLLDTEGRVFAELIGVEAVLRPGALVPVAQGEVA